MGFLEQFLQSGYMSQKDAERLRGRLPRFESFAHGRIAQQALRTVSGIASVGRKQTQLTCKEISALKFLKDRVLTAPPTQIQATNLSTWICFSDGACEGDQNKLGTIGAVLVNPAGLIHRFFSEKVPEFVMEGFLKNSTHPIFELELLPIWCALCLWETWVRHSQCVYYIDNEGAQAAMINAAASTENGQRIIEDFVLNEMRCQVKVWFSRVLTHSNLSDKPSRLETTELDASGSPRDSVDWDMVQTKLFRAGS